MDIKDLEKKGKMAIGGIVGKGKELSDSISVLLEKGVIYLPKEQMKEFKEKYGEDMLEKLNSGKAFLGGLLKKKKAE